MLDYLTHYACLQSIRAETATRLAKEPDARLQAASDAVANRLPLAVLGALTDRLFEHTEGTADQELALLEEATTIWPHVLSLINRVATIRATLEGIVKDPTQADVIMKFNAVSTELTALQPQFTTLTAQLQAYLMKLQPQNFVRQHGQELNLPAEKWTFRDIALSRRTGLFAANLARLARNSSDDDIVAFTYGALAGYAGNVVGRGYLNQTIGGPRRSHPYRSRLAENAVGMWLDSANPATSAGGLLSLRSKITFGAPNSPTLPPKIEKLLKEAIAHTYKDKVPTAPNLQEAYAKMIRHLELLTSFDLGAPPSPIDVALSSKIAALSPQDVAASGPQDAPGTAGGPPPSAPASGSSNDHSWVYWVLFVVCIVLVAACYLFGICSNKQGVDAPKYPDPTTNDPGNVAAVQSYLQSDAATVQVNRFFNLHVALYDCALGTQTVMKLLGLLYPIAPELGKSMYAQFLITPPNPFLAPAFANVHRPSADPALITAAPTSPPEHPTPAHLNPFATGSFATAILSGVTTGTVPTVSDYGTKLWWLEAVDSADSDVRHTNRNLDGDRGPLHECWSVPAGTIMVDPLPTVTILGYHDF